LDEIWAYPLLNSEKQGSGKQSFPGTFEFPEISELKIFYGSKVRKNFLNGPKEKFGEKSWGNAQLLKAEKNLPERKWVAYWNPQIPKKNPFFLKRAQRGYSPLFLKRTIPKRRKRRTPKIYKLPVHENKKKLGVLTVI